MTVLAPLELFLVRETIPKVLVFVSGAIPPIVALDHHLSRVRLQNGSVTDGLWGIQQGKGVDEGLLGHLNPEKRNKQLWEFKKKKQQRREHVMGRCDAPSLCCYSPAGSSGTEECGRLRVARRSHPRSDLRG